MKASYINQLERKISDLEFLILAIEVICSQDIELRMSGRLDAIRDQGIILLALLDQVLHELQKPKKRSKR